MCNLAHVRKSLYGFKENVNLCLEVPVKKINLEIFFGICVFNVLKVAKVILSI